MSASIPTVLRVALALPVPRLFDYLPPVDRALQACPVDARVRVPFGRGHRIGVIAAIGPAETPAAALRRAEAVIDEAPLFDAELAATLRWAANYYQRALGEVFATALPGPLRQGDALPGTARVRWRLTEAGATALSGLRAGARPRALAERLARGPHDAEALAELSQWRATLRLLLARGFAEAVEDHGPATRVPSRPAPPLHPAQQRAVDAIAVALGTFAPLLLDGVTGSGKTEVYLAAIEACLARGRQALVLVPEIGLTPQALRRYGERLPVPVHALHSGLSEGERARAWAAMARGDARVLIGTRSAVFTPLPQAGLIVVDEEHDASYKQQDGFRYHARDLALVRGKALGVPVLLGSATPALETLQHAMAGRYTWLRLSERAGGARTPQVHVLDVRALPLADGLSRPLLTAIGDCLARGEQALVFRNRRGFAPVLLCHDCGWHADCDRCDSAMTLHGRHRLVCHHCGAQRRVPAACPSCESLGLVPQGAGTERLEQALAAAFPGTPLIRVDRETTQHRDALDRHFAALGDRPGILVGTQMLAKGHDLPNLTLVAIASIDDGLFSADFRAGERLAQLLIQVAGRAGRAARPGAVWLQTHHPDHPLLRTLLAGGYHAFAAEALVERRVAGFPPSAHLCLLRAEATTQPALDAFLAAACAVTDRLLAAAPKIDADGGPAVVRHAPVAAPMPRRAGRLRAQMLLSSPRRSALQHVTRMLFERLHSLREAKKVRWSLDVDPADMY